MRDKMLLMISASLELVTGLALIAVPGVVASVLIGAELSPAGEAVGRVGGMGLLSMAIACWPGGDGDRPEAIRALFVYNLLAGVYLCYLRFSGEFSSILLLPAGVLHVLLALFFARPAYASLSDSGRIDMASPKSE